MRITYVMVVACAVYVLSAVAPRVLVHWGLADGDVFKALIVSKLILSVLSVLTGILLFKQPLSAYSLKHGSRGAVWPYGALAFLTGALTTAFILVFKIPPIKFLTALSFPQYLIAVWVASTICEEVFARGLVQGVIDRESSSGPGMLTPGIISGAVIFSAIHFSIYVVGGSLSTCLVIMTATLLLGFLCGFARRRSGLFSAILVHLLFNIGAFIGGVLTTIITKLV